MTDTPNFTGWSALILHREDGNTQKLVRHLRLLGMECRQLWNPVTRADLADLVLVDGDQGWNGLLPWSEQPAERPVVALLGSEAPGRISWAMAQGAGAFLSKPVTPSAIYPALVMAVAIHRERLMAAERNRFLEERIRMRPLVHAAIERLMRAQGLDEERAYRLLRDRAMERRMQMEQMAASILGGVDPLPEAG